MEEVKIGAMRGRNPDNPSERGKSNGNYQQCLEINENGTSNTITSVQKDNLVIEPTEDTATTICLNSKVDGKQPSLEHRIYDCSGNSTAITTGFHPSIAEPKVEQVGNIYPDTDNFKNRTMGRVYSDNGISPTINCCGGGDREPKIILEQPPKYRIRKLTCREVFRLMDVDDSDIDKIQAAGISNSQQYKLAGNSIVCSCLYHLFRKLFVETENENQQLSLF